MENRSFDEKDDRSAVEDLIRLGSVLECLPQMVWTQENARGAGYYNRKWLEFTGVDLEKSGHFRRADLIHPDDREWALAAWEAAQLSGSYEAEYRLKHHSGQFRWILSRGIPRRDDSGKIVAWYGTCTDVHEQALAREALHASEALTRSIIQSSVDRMLLLNLSGTIEFLNQAATADLDPHGTSARPGVQWIDVLPHGAKVDGEKAFALALHGGRGNLMFSATGADGNQKCWDTVVTPIARNGEVERLLVVSRDITNATEAQQKLQGLQSELAHASRINAMGMMASTLAHELNQPLAAIRAYLTSCKRMLAGVPGDTSLVDKGLEQSLRSTDRASDIIRGMRSLAQRTSSRKQINDVSTVVDEALQFTLIGMGRSEVDISVDLQTGVMAEIDPVQIQQVILNLVTNALEAMQNERTKKLHVMVRRNGKQVLVKVSDTGSGLDEKIKNRLFQPFSSTKENGMGVGLSICGAIAANHGGGMRAEENAEGGTDFYLCLPAAD